MLTSDQYTNTVTKTIDKVFTRDGDVDIYGRKVNYVYIKLINGSWQKNRLANVRVGNIFKMNDIIYRALEDPFYSIKEDKVYIKAVLYDDYLKDVTESNKPYSFSPRSGYNKVCRGGK